MQWPQQAVESAAGWRFFRICEADSCRVFGTDRATLDACMASQAQTLKHDRTTTVCRYQGPGGALILKRYNPRSFWHKIKRAFRRSRARRCWQMSYAFAASGLRVARPLMMLEHRFGPIRRTAYFVSESVDGDEVLHCLPNLTATQQVAVAEAVREAFARMRAARITHGDMKASNLIWTGSELVFIDLDAAQTHWTTWGWRRKHAKDRRRFLKNWQDQPDLLALFDNI
ncbi:lipopolysaccharide kinase InaA family protein [Arenicella chitinivorans]|nr:lipopolysaccharide kinase InaA family protein [Arenicella chitinivorans]